MKISKVEFYNFNRRREERLITHDSECYAIFSRNPYGSHNLILASVDDQGYLEAFAHGNEDCLSILKNWKPKLYKKAARFLATKGLYARSERAALFVGSEIVERKRVYLSSIRCNKGVAV